MDSELLMTPKDLRTRRIALGITVGELAEEVHLPIKLVASLEKGEEPIEQPEVFMRAFERMNSRVVIPKRASRRRATGDDQS